MKKRFILEVEEGVVPNCELCPFVTDGRWCCEYGFEDDGLLNCNKYDLTTMTIKEEQYEDVELKLVEK